MQHCRHSFVTLTGSDDIWLHYLHRTLRDDVLKLPAGVKTFARRDRHRAQVLQAKQRLQIVTEDRLFDKHR
eukprot:COSAG06_NODE_29215_length_560_cov_1.223427_2_plen_70_part_01